MWEQLLAMLQQMPMTPPTLLDPSKINTTIRTPTPVTMAPRPIKPPAAPTQTQGSGFGAPNMGSLFMNGILGNGMNWRAISDNAYLRRNGGMQQQAQPSQLGQVMTPTAR